MRGRGTIEREAASRRGAVVGLPPHNLAGFALLWGCLFVGVGWFFVDINNDVCEATPLSAGH
eukprot:6053204-Prymnesium_polylepis.1